MVVAPDDTAAVVAATWTMVGVTCAVGALVTVCIAIGRMLAVGVVVTVGFTAAVGADCADDITEDPSPVATATFLRTVGPLSLSCC